MSNPLIDKYEELYGEKKEEEVVEEKKEESPTTGRYTSAIGLPGGMGNDHLIFGSGGSDTISLNPAHAKVGLSINGGQEVMDSGAFVIPAATVNNGVMNMDGSYISPSTLISNKPPMPNTFCLPQITEMDKSLCKVMDDVAKGKAILSSIRADIDQSFTGFGGQIRYSIEVVGTYP